MSFYNDILQYWLETEKEVFLEEIGQFGMVHALVSFHSASV